MNLRPDQIREGEESFAVPKRKRKSEPRKSWNSTLKAPAKRMRPVAKGKHKTVAMEDHHDSVASLECAFCGAPPPSTVHHIRRLGEAKNHWRVVPACKACHLVTENPDALIHGRGKEAAEHEERAFRAITWELYGPDEGIYRHYLELGNREP